MSSCGVGQYFEKVSSKEKLGNNGAGETIFFSAKNLFYIDDEMLYSYFCVVQYFSPFCLLPMAFAEDSFYYN